MLYLSIYNKIRIIWMWLNMKKRNILLVFIVFIDQLTKILVNKFFKPNESLVIIKKILYITNAHNKGAAWSILSGNTLLLILISILSIYLIYKMTKDYDDLFLGILYGGILGNLIDRLFLVLFSS